MISIRDLVLSRFRETFHAEPAWLARAPGRVNLLGEHIDYNDGVVMPVAIDRETWLAFRPLDSDRLSLVAADLSESTELLMRNLDERMDVHGQVLPGWAHYPGGVAWSLLQNGLEVSGMQGVYASNVPVGAGLSSSASVEMAFAVAWQALGGWSLPPMELALLCQRAENRYAGVHCGIMDQFASGCGRSDHALFLDCRARTWEAVPLPADIAIIVADTAVRRTLASSEYNARRAQCEEAVAILRQVESLRSIQALRDVSPQEFRRHADLLPDMKSYYVEEISKHRIGKELIRIPSR